MDWILNPLKHLIFKTILIWRKEFDLYVASFEARFISEYFKEYLNTRPEDLDRAFDEAKPEEKERVRKLVAEVQGAKNRLADTAKIENQLESYVALLKGKIRI